MEGGLRKDEVVNFEFDLSCFDFREVAFIQAIFRICILHNYLTQGLLGCNKTVY